MKTESVNKKKNVIVIVFVVVFVILLLLLLGLVLHKQKGGKSGVNNSTKLTGIHIVDGVTQENEYSISYDGCTDDSLICVNSVVITHRANKGKITYTINNKGTSTATGKLRVTIDGKKFVFPYSNLAPNGTVDGVYGYDNYTFNFDGLNDFQVDYISSEDSAVLYESLSEQEKATIHVQ